MAWVFSWSPLFRCIILEHQVQFSWRKYYLFLKHFHNTSIVQSSINNEVLLWILTIFFPIPFQNPFSHILFRNPLVITYLLMHLFNESMLSRLECRISINNVAVQSLAKPKVDYSTFTSSKIKPLLSFPASSTLTSITSSSTHSSLL